MEALTTAQQGMLHAVSLHTHKCTSQCGRYAPCIITGPGTDDWCSLQLIPFIDSVSTNLSQHHLPSFLPELSPPQEGPSPPPVKGEECVCVCSILHKPTLSWAVQCCVVVPKLYRVAMSTADWSTWLAHNYPQFAILPNIHFIAKVVRYSVSGQEYIFSFLLSGGCLSSMSLLGRVLTSTFNGSRCSDHFMYFSVIDCCGFISVSLLHHTGLACSTGRGRRSVLSQTVHAVGESLHPQCGL